MSEPRLLRPREVGSDPINHITSRFEERKSDPPKNRPRPLAGHQRRRHPEKATYLTADNQMARKPNLALNAEIESMAERLTGPEITDPR
jgi:hypothetical protein